MGKLFFKNMLLMALCAIPFSPRILRASAAPNFLDPAEKRPLEEYNNNIIELIKYHTTNLKLTDSQFDDFTRQFRRHVSVLEPYLRKNGVCLSTKSFTICQKREGKLKSYELRWGDIVIVQGCSTAKRFKKIIACFDFWWNRPSPSAITESTSISPIPEVGSSPAPLVTAAPVFLDPEAKHTPDEYNSNIIEMLRYYASERSLSNYQFLEFTLLLQEHLRKLSEHLPEEADRVRSCDFIIRHKLGGSGRSYQLRCNDLIIAENCINDKRFDEIIRCFSPTPADGIVRPQRKAPSFILADQQCDPTQRVRNIAEVTLYYIFWEPHFTPEEHFDAFLSTLNRILRESSVDVKRHCFDVNKEERIKYGTRLSLLTFFQDWLRERVGKEHDRKISERYDRALEEFLKPPAERWVALQPKNAFEEKQKKYNLKKEHKLALAVLELQDVVREDLFASRLAELADYFSHDEIRLHEPLVRLKKGGMAPVIDFFDSSKLDASTAHRLLRIKGMIAMAQRAFADKNAKAADPIYDEWLAEIAASKKGLLDTKQQGTFKRQAGAHTSQHADSAVPSGEKKGSLATFFKKVGVKRAILAATGLATVAGFAAILQYRYSHVEKKKLNATAIRTA